MLHQHFSPRAPLTFGTKQFFISLCNRSFHYRTFVIHVSLVIVTTQLDTPLISQHFQSISTYLHHLHFLKRLYNSKKNALPLYSLLLSKAPYMVDIELIVVELKQLRMGLKLMIPAINVKNEGEKLLRETFN